MIKINLLHEKKTKRGEQNQQFIFIALFVLGGVAALLYILLHSPLQAELATVSAANARLEKKNKELQVDTKDFDAIKTQAEAVQAQAEAITRLNNARAVPAWMLRELSGILTRGQEPTMTKEMAERVRTDRNRQWSRTWDPKRVWIEKLEEKKGEFTLTGGAQSDGDVTQLALRLMASVYFEEIAINTVSMGSATAKGGAGGGGTSPYYKFEIKGRVNY